MSEKCYDIVVIGAGPHSLSLLTRLLVDVPDKYEERPSNRQLFSCKNGKYQAKIKDNPQTQRTPRQISNFLRSNQNNEEVLKKICVIDKYGCWMNQWSKQFDILGISHLRSTISVQPEAYDLNALIAFATNQKRLTEVHDISRDLRGGKFTGPFIIPSVELFWDFCKHIVKLHNLENVVQKGEVVDIQCLSSNLNKKLETKKSKNSDADANLFKITLKNGEALFGKNIVISIGNIGTKNIPDWAMDLYGKDNSILHTTDLIFQSKALGISNPKISNEEKLENFCDLDLNKISYKSSTNLNSVEKNCFKNDQVCYKGENVLIVGGGLSSGHLVIKAIEMGANKVYLVCQSEIKVKQFDLDLEWIGRSRFIKLAEFYSMQDPNERLMAIKQARQGGSITPFVFDKLKQLETEEKIEIFTETEVWSCCKENENWMVELSNNESINVNLILLATGSKINIQENQIFSKILENFPTQIIDGLPVLTDDLEWGLNSNVFVMGAYGALQLGPDALNLAGARGGASRISHKLKPKLFKKDNVML